MRKRQRKKNFKQGLSYDGSLNKIKYFYIKKSFTKKEIDKFEDEWSSFFFGGQTYQFAGKIPVIKGEYNIHK